MANKSDQQNTDLQNGFTLGELLMSIMVIGISVSVAIPGFQTAMNNSRRTTVVNELVTTMHMARSEAITRNVQVTVCPSSDGLNCAAVAWEDGWIYFADDDGDRTVDAGEVLLGALPGNNRLTINSVEYPAFIAFRPNGRALPANPPTNTGDVVVCDPRGAEFARVLIVGASGQPRLSEHMADGSDPVCP